MISLWFVLVTAQAPDFVHGEECLFCHRNNIGTEWKKNRHGLTVQAKEDGMFKLGSRGVVRELRKEGYGKFAIRDAADTWDKDKFGEKCSGCHATAVDSKTKTFAYFGLDCYTCHGDVDLNHSSDTSLVWLSKKRRSDRLAVTSICAQCHLREGAVSKSTKAPFPDNFVAGRNLFDDLQVDWSKADDPQLNAGDRHVYRNVRDVLTKGSETTCLSCHKVHGGSSTKHRLVLTNESCLDCHNAEGPKKATKPYTVKSALCEY